MKIVINRCFGGFGLSETAMIELAHCKGYTHFTEKNRYHYLKTPQGDILTENDIPRDDLDLVAIVEKLGENSFGEFAELMIVDVPDDVDWYIEEYDGREWVAERHRVWP